MCLTVSVQHFVALNTTLWEKKSFFFFPPCSDLLYRLLLCYSIFPCFRGFVSWKGWMFLVFSCDFPSLGFEFLFICICYLYCFYFSQSWISSLFSCLFLVVFYHFLSSPLLSLVAFTPCVCLAFCGCQPCFDWSHLCLVHPSLFLLSPQPPPLRSPHTVLLFVLLNLFTWVSLPPFSTTIPSSV